ncbi:MAG: glycosyltransferase [Gemmatimonadaceae bacterium]
MRVLTVAYSLGVVGPRAVGGAEQVPALLDRALVEAGWESCVVACEGSRVCGTLCATPAPRGALDQAARRAAIEAHRRAVTRALDRWPADVVHAHGVDFHEYLPPLGVPLLVTLHLPPAWYPAHALRPNRPETYLHCVSEAQRRQCAADVRLLPTIPNGVSLTRLRPGGRKGGYVVALGRICVEKGYHLALDAAHRAGVPLVLAGRVVPFPEHQRYFAEEIRPRLDARRRYVGPVAGARKRRLLAGARALLVPSLCPETSSLVAMEALACGTPVVAFPAGALPEIVEHGVTGLVVGDVETMAEAIGAAAALEPRDCRAAARARFSDERTASAYLDRYALLASGRALELAS